MPSFKIRYFKAIMVSLSLSACIAWMTTIELRIRSNQTLLSLMVSCTPGTPEKTLVGQLKPVASLRYLDNVEIPSRFPGVIIPSGGHTILFDSYGAGELPLVSPIHTVLVLIGKDGCVKGYIFSP